MTLKGSDGRHRLTGFESGFYEGTLAADGALDLRETPARWQLAPKAERVRLESLLAALGEEPARDQCLPGTVHHCRHPAGQDP